jgi:hypothetical protein
MRQGDLAAVSFYFEWYFRFLKHGLFLQFLQQVEAANFFVKFEIY